MCNKCKSDAIRCYREFGKLKDECERLEKDNAMLTRENQSLKEKTEACDSASNCDVKESLSQLVVNGKALERRMN